MTLLHTTTPRTYSRIYQGLHKRPISALLKKKYILNSTAPLPLFDPFRLPFLPHSKRRRLVFRETWGRVHRWSRTEAWKGQKASAADLFGLFGHSQHTTWAPPLTVQKMQLASLLQVYPYRCLVEKCLDVKFPILTSVSLPICCGKLKHKRGQSMLLCSFLDLYRCLNPMRGFVMCHLTSMLSIKDAAETQNRLHFHQMSEGQINKLFTLVYKNGVRRHRRWACHLLWARKWKRRIQEIIFNKCDF